MNKVCWFAWTSSVFTLWYGLVASYNCLTKSNSGSRCVCTLFRSNVPYEKQEQPTGRHRADKWGCQAVKQKWSLFYSVTYSRKKKSWWYIINNFPKSEIRTLKVREKETENSKWLLEWVEIQGRTRKLTCRTQWEKGLRATQGLWSFFPPHSQQLHLCTILNSH